MRRWVASSLDGVPLLFIGIVLGVAVLFRLTIDVLRPASTDDVAAAPLVAPHEPPASRAPAPAPLPEPSVDAPRAAAAAPSPPRAASPKRKPRTHGRR